MGTQLVRIDRPRISSLTTRRDSPSPEHRSLQIVVLTPRLGDLLVGYTIDLRARIVPDTLRVWRLFPGRDYRFVDDFRQQGVVFLDFPGLPLPDGPLNETPDDLAERILISNALAEWCYLVDRADISERDLLPRPSTNPNDYKEKRRPRNLAIDKGAIMGLFGQPAKGDLVVVPLPISTRQVLVGEFVHAPDRRVTASSNRYKAVGMVARQVRWFDPVNEMALSERVSEIIRRPNPFVSFDIRLYREIFDHSFGTYVDKDGFTAKFNTNSQVFTAGDNFNFMLLAEAVAKLVEEIERSGDISKYNSLLELASSQRDEKYEIDLSININSPGSILSKSTTTVALALAALLSIAQVASAEDGKPAVKIVNTSSGNTSSGADDDKCTPEIDIKVRTMIEFMQMAVWKDACERSRKLRENPRMQGVATVHPDVQQLPTTPQAR
jgi:hypothetical protein